MELEKFRVQVVATTIAVADVFVEAISSEDAHAIAVASCKPEDFEVQEIITVNATESVMTNE